MKFHKFIFLLFFQFYLGFSFSQNVINLEENKISTPLYEISYNKSYYDFYEQINYGFALFYKFDNNDDDFLDSIRLSIENLQKFNTMDLDYYASLVEYGIKGDSKIIESKKVENNEKQPYFLIVYEKKLGENNVKVYHRIYFNNGYGFNFSLSTVTNKFDKLYSESEEIFNSFNLLN
jgi:hypothetical protein